MNNDKAKELIDRYQNGTCTPEEKAMVETWYNKLADSQQDLSTAPDYQARFRQLTEGLPQEIAIVKESPSLWPKIAIAAAVLIILSFGIYFYQQKNKAVEQTATTQIDVDPGSNKAVLTLADGRKIDLNNARQGALATESGITIKKSTDGELVYTATDDPYVATKFNTIETPKGGQYQVRLPDGTKVWLNAASSLKYPTSFAAAGDRRVELSGEAYFEVAKDKKHPFFVKTALQNVEVLGTHFNVNSYTNESKTVTTLLEGSVRVNLADEGADMSHAMKISPGEQTLTERGSINVAQADLETAMAWKNNNIVFKSASLESIMRQVERWYDVRVVYEGKVPARYFSGGISRESKLSVLLSVLKESGINFEIREEGGKKELIVKP